MLQQRCPPYLTRNLKRKKHTLQDCLNKVCMYIQICYLQWPHHVHECVLPAVATSRAGVCVTCSGHITCRSVCYLQWPHHVQECVLPAVATSRAGVCVTCSGHITCTSVCYLQWPHHVHECVLPAVATSRAGVCYLQ